MRRPLVLCGFLVLTLLIVGCQKEVAVAPDGDASYGFVDPELVARRYAEWLAAQEADGRLYTEAQRWWLDRIAEAIGLSLGVELEDLQRGEMHDRGGVIAAEQLFYGRMPAILEEMNAVLVR